MGAITVKVPFLALAVSGVPVATPFAFVVAVAFVLPRYTFLRLIGDLRGKSVLDLACGEGYYTRELRHPRRRPSCRH
jgi:hypothetical protein